MTYKEYFMKYETMEELLKEVKEKTTFAIALNKPDRIKAIEKAMNEVINEKNW